MMKKKILYLITKATWGGAQRYVYDLATHLPSAKFSAQGGPASGWQPSVAYGTAGKLSSDLKQAGIAIYELPSLGRDIAIISDIRSFFQIIRCIRNVRPDVLHVNSSKAAALGALAGRLCRVPKIVFTVHGWPFKENRNVLSRAIIYFISWFTAFLSHATIVVSKTDKGIGDRVWSVHKKIYYIPLALKSAGTYSREQAAKILFDGPSAPFQNATRLVTIAELTHNKGLKYGIDMMSELERRTPGKYKYAIVGKGEEGHSLASYAQNKNVALSVWFVYINPPINRPPADLSSEAARFLPAFDIFVLPSIKEGMPYVLLEAAAAGLPIVATDVVKEEASSLPNIHFVPSGNGHALADAVEKLAQNLPAKQPGMVGSFADMLKKTVELYDSGSLTAIPE